MRDRLYMSVCVRPRTDAAAEYISRWVNCVLVARCTPLRMMGLTHTHKAHTF